jgi:serine O-acetyltransferase
MSARYVEAERRLRVPPLNERGVRNENPEGMSLWELVREDFRTHNNDLLEQGFWAIAVHRFGNWRMDRPKLVRAPCTALYVTGFKLVEVFAGITLSYGTKLGRRVRIWHHGGMVLGARYIGNDVHIRQNVTLGVAQTLRIEDLPIIEDGVDIGCGAAILGRAHVGKGARIGANSVVLHDLPDDASVMGVPAKIVSPPSSTKPQAPSNDAISEATALRS